MNKILPMITTDEEAELLLEQDLSDYIHAGNFQPVRFEFLPKKGQVNLRVSTLLLDAIKEKAKRRE